MEGRQLRGMQIAEHGGLKETPRGWIVPAQCGSGTYFVQNKDGKYTCDCPDCQLRSTTCKHQWAVIYTIQKKVTVKKTTDKKGNTTVTKETKITYTQDWRAYNSAQTKEIKLFDILLKDLVECIDEPEQKIGRPRLRLKEQMFCAIQKVYSQLSQRRAHTLYRNAEGREQINHAPHFNAVGRLLNKEDLTPMLHNLLNITAMPLKDIETTFAPDSSGFRTTTFDQYPIYKYGTEKVHRWLKAHILVGVKTNVIASARVTEGDGEGTGDSTQYEPMVIDAHKYGFEIKEIPADMGYSSRDNHNLADSIGAVPYIPFRKNASGKSKGSSTWWKMFNYFQLHKEEFLQHYHQRSNVETTFMMVKTKLGDKLKSKNPLAQKNELLCKLIAHNIIVLIHEMHELGIRPDFKTC